MLEPRAELEFAACRLLHLYYLIGSKRLLPDLTGRFSHVLATNCSQVVRSSGCLMKWLDPHWLIRKTYVILIF